MAKSGEQATPTADMRVIVLHGQDAFLQDERMRQLREAMTAKHGEGGFDTVRFEGATSNSKPNASILADMFDECRSMGLMQQHKVVVVNNADILLKESDSDAPAAPPAPRGKGKGKGGGG